MQSKRGDPGAKPDRAGRVAPEPRRGAREAASGADADREGLAAGLYLVSTPIGNAADISLRALKVLECADAIAAEDTRQTRKLMEIHGIALRGRPMTPYHDRNGPKARPRIAAWLEEGCAVAYCTDAGSPLIADPGYRLAQLAIENGHPVTTVPGASAVLAALPLSGLPTDRFFFGGFLPTRSGERGRALHEVAGLRATLVYYESPRRLAATLADMALALGASRPAAVARELTKLHEEVRRGTLGELAAAFAEGPAPRGEIVILVGAAGDDAAGADAKDLDAALRAALSELSVKDAAREVAAALGLPRREVYARALELSKARDEER
ncbi:16S rRNA (cytidine(1402)-2'-O)-methyltransferase [Limibaculum sp. M0105]|uniref:Ribosomal RNA small subunit methyltransferase I n=1 Tax=Thermohalobaculum xanthum TaxID=2753746 RepID=A0A8J7M8Y3_9RHOB|nr:16S rRNA (cytidine(1402)-2'-O)-methyltransferase [Thermohalobaculum xanthum]MBK0400484.1 16S rRNA (cytidine(1402)-2'-O)-methyltransferase [Thermohalobaculum xanthum]